MGNSIKSLTNDLIGYITEQEYQNFSEWFYNEGWEDSAVCLSFEMDELSKELANYIACSAIFDETTPLVQCLAYHSKGEHVYASAIKLAVLLKLMKVPKLTKTEIKQFLLDTKEDNKLACSNARLRDE